MVVGDILDQSINLGMFGIDVRALISARQETALPILGLLNRITTGTHHHKARHILVVTAQSVGDPRTKARSYLTRFSAIHQE